MDNSSRNIGFNYVFGVVHLAVIGIFFYVIVKYGVATSSFDLAKVC